MTLPVFTIRNHLGQYLGSYRAKNAKLAIQRFMDDQRRESATFRKSVRMPNFEGITATVETKEESR